MMWHEAKRSISHTEELIPKNIQKIFKIWFSKSYSPSGVTKHTYFGNFTCPQTHFGRPKPSDEC